eukprot:2859683-Amphidinium_carterae.1
MSSKCAPMQLDTLHIPLNCHMSAAVDGKICSTCPEWHFLEKSSSTVGKDLMEAKPISKPMPNPAWQARKQFLTGP